MSNFLYVVEKAVADLAWSLWTELGAPGPARMHQDYVVDPESLLAYSDAIADLDPRVRAFADIWKQKYSVYLSRARLQREKDKLPPGTAILPPAQGPASSKSRLQAFARPPRVETDFLRSAAVLLRSRALCGVSARSDLLVHLLYAPMQGRSAAQLSSLLSLNRYNLSQSLNLLAATGVCTVWSEKNRHLFGLAARGALAQLLAPLPKHLPPWPDIFRFMLTCRIAARNEAGVPPDVAAIEADVALAPFYPWLRRGGVRPPANRGDPEKYWDELARFCGTACRSLATGDSPLLTMLA